MDTILNQLIPYTNIVPKELPPIYDEFIQNIHDEFMSYFKQMYYIHKSLKYKDKYISIIFTLNNNGIFYKTLSIRYNQYSFNNKYIFISFFDF